MSVENLTSPFWGSMNSLHNPPSYSDMDYDTFSLARQQQIETSYCRDFICCGKYLENLHTLVQHCDEHHSTPSQNNVFNLLRAFPQKHTPSYDTIDPYVTHNSMFQPSCHEVVQDTATSMAPSSTLSSQSDSLSPCEGSTTENGEQPQLSDMALAKEIQRISSSVIPAEEWMAKVSALFKLQVDDTSEKPYKCTEYGCNKSYKNANGLKYHRIHGHCEAKQEAKNAQRKPYSCTIGPCRKRYKNMNGLKYHIQHTHVAQLYEALT